MWSLYLKNIANVTLIIKTDLKKHKMSGWAMLDKIEEEVNESYEKLDKMHKAID